MGQPAQELRPGDGKHSDRGQALAVLRRTAGSLIWPVEVPGTKPPMNGLEAVDNTVYFKATGKEV